MEGACQRGVVSISRGRVVSIGRCCVKLCCVVLCCIVLQG